MPRMKLTIGRKLAGLVGLELVAIAVILVIASLQMRSTLMEERRLAIRNVVEVADNTVRYYARLAEQGKLGVAEAQAQAVSAISVQRYAGTEYVWINDLEHRMIYHPSPKLHGTNAADLKDANGKRMVAAMVELVKQQGQGYVEYVWPHTAEGPPVLKVSYVRGTAWGWVVGTGVYADDIATTAAAKALQLGAGLLVVAAILAGLSLALNRTITRPLRETVGLLGDLAAGDGHLSRRLPETSGDELGDLARAFNVFTGKLRDLIAETRGVAGQMSQASRQLQGAAGHVASATQGQASSLEQTAASLEEITGTVKQNADHARQANQLAVASRDSAEKGGRVVNEAVTAMAEINQASRRIAAIITTIDEIAFQTNLLALNAAVEAARAGEQGRGFAVVAAEVRNLAQRSATAAREIKTLIEDSVRKVEAGSELVNRSGQTLEEIVTSVKRVTDIIAEIAAASQEQTAGVDQVNRAVTQMDQGVQGTSAQAGALSTTAHALAGQAVQLEALVSRFRLDQGDRGGGRLDGAMGVDLAKAVRAHMDWKMRLRGYVDHPDGSLDPEVIARRDACPLGQWLETGGRQWSDWPGYCDLLEEHARFHREAAAIVRLTTSGARAEAAARLAAGSTYAEVSTRVVQLIERLAADLAMRRPAGPGRSTPKATRAPSTPAVTAGASVKGPGASATPARAPATARAGQGRPGPGRVSLGTPGHTGNGSAHAKDDGFEEF